MNRKGIALVLALATIMVVSGMGTLLFLRTTGEIRHSLQDQRIVQTLMLARGAANMAGSYLALKGREALDSLVQNTANLTGRWAYGQDTNPMSGLPDPITVAGALTPLAQNLQQTVDSDLCNLNLAPSTLPGSVTVRVYFTNAACGRDLPQGVSLPPGRFVEGAPRSGSGEASNQTYALPFVAVAQAQVGPYRRNIVSQGEYRFTVGRSSFARFALFTQIHTLPNGTEVWFTDRTLFDGPVHTNGHFRFYRRPWFGGEVTSAGCESPGDQACQVAPSPGAYFYGRGFVSTTGMQPDPSRPSVTNSYGTHAPEFTAGVDWQARFIPLPQNNQNQRNAAQNRGLYFGRTVTSLRLFMGCLDTTTGGSVPCTRPLPPGVVKYQYIDATYCTNNACSSTAEESYRYGEDGILQRALTQGSQTVWENVLRDGQPIRFNGVIFSEGEIQNLRGPDRTDPNNPTTAAPALAEFAQITVAAVRTIRIANDLKYEVPPCSGTPTRNPDGSVSPATCNNLQARNVLGVYSQAGDVLIRGDAPKDLHIHATLMSSSGVVQVENYNSIPAKGSIHLMGGVIQKYYGAFGTFNSQTGQNSTGYGRAFTYDRRFLLGIAPPHFPTTGQDQVQSISIFSYGQREQVY